MKLMIEIAAAALLVVCISATSAAFAAGKAGKSADGLGVRLHAVGIQPNRRPIICVDQMMPLAQGRRPACCCCHFSRRAPTAGSASPTRSFVPGGTMGLLIPASGEE